MYKAECHHQISLEDFNQPLGIQLDPNNRWIKKAALIPWSELEPTYAGLFASDTGHPAKNFRMALGSLLIQTEFDWSNEETVAQIRENPYLQYFVGLHSFQWEKPFDASTMVHFSKRLSHEKIEKINEKILAHHEKPLKDNQEDNEPKPPSGGDTDNQGTLMLDATCAPANIRYPQDVSLLNESREKAEGIIDELCRDTPLKKPRTGRKAARKAYLTFSKSKKRTYKKRQKAVKKQLCYVSKDIHHIERLQEQGAVLNENQAITFYTL